MINLVFLTALLFIGCSNEKPHEENNDIQQTINPEETGGTPASPKKVTAKAVARNKTNTPTLGDKTARSNTKSTTSRKTSVTTDLRSVYESKFNEIVSLAVMDQIREIAMGFSGLAQQVDLMESIALKNIKKKTYYYKSKKTAQKEIEQNILKLKKLVDDFIKEYNLKNEIIFEFKFLFDILNKMENVYYISIKNSNTLIGEKTVEKILKMNNRTGQGNKKKLLKQDVELLVKLLATFKLIKIDVNKEILALQYIHEIKQEKTFSKKLELTKKPVPVKVDLDVLYMQRLRQSIQMYEIANYAEALRILNEINP
ncbi:MAG: hypothetical protein AAF320_02400 [Myxococcota bacterium]